MKLIVIIKGWILWLWYYINEDYRNSRKIEAMKRIIICESCDNFVKNSRRCSLCGCFMDVKSKMKFELDENGKSINGCQIKKW